MRRTIGAAVIAAAILSACGASAPTTGHGSQSGQKPTPTASEFGNPTKIVSLQAGVTTLLPALQQAAPQLNAAYPNIELTLTAGDGTATAAQGAFVAEAETNLSSETPSNVEVLPVALAGEQVYVALPGVSGLRLNGDVLAQIYLDQIWYWNDPAIAALNPGLQLPDLEILPYFQQAPSVQTLVFTTYLADSNGQWSNNVGAGMSVQWPQGDIDSSNDFGAGGIIYVQAGTASADAASYSGGADRGLQSTPGVSAVALENAAGQFVTSSPASMQAVATAVKGTALPVNLPGSETYPLASFAFIAVDTSQTDANNALALRTFLSWLTNGGGKQYLNGPDTTPAPASLIHQDDISRIKAPTSTTKA